MSGGACQACGVALKAVWDRSGDEPRVSGWRCPFCSRAPVGREARKEMERVRAVALLSARLPTLLHVAEHARRPEDRERFTEEAARCRDQLQRLEGGYET